MTLDRVAEHRPWHARVVLGQKGIEDSPISVPHFAEHPAHCLMDQVLRIIYQQGGNGQCWPKLPVPDEVLGGDYGNPTLPEVRRFREIDQQRDVLRRKVRPDYLRRRRIDEVPVIYALRVLEIRTVNTLLLPLVTSLVRIDQQQNSKKPLFVPL